MSRDYPTGLLESVTQIAGYTILLGISFKRTGLTNRAAYWRQRKREPRPFIAWTGRCALRVTTPPIPIGSRPETIEEDVNLVHCKLTSRTYWSSFFVERLVHQKTTIVRSPRLPPTKQDFRFLRSTCWDEDWRCRLPGSAWKR